MSGEHSSSPEHLEKKKASIKSSSWVRVTFILINGIWTLLIGTHLPATIFGTAGY
jgi:hypothetical protein